MRTRLLTLLHIAPVGVEGVTTPKPEPSDTHHRDDERHPEHRLSSHCSLLSFVMYSFRETHAARVWTYNSITNTIVAYRNTPVKPISISAVLWLKSYESQ